MVQLLVVGMRNPEQTLANARGYRGWVMRRKQSKLGSPFAVAIWLLRWDRIRVVQTVAAYRCRYGAA
jgi:hypothetical protein